MKRLRFLLLSWSALWWLTGASMFAQSIDSVVAFTGQNSLTNYGHVGDQVYIYGNGFSTAGNLQPTVTFNGASVAGQVVADTEIFVTKIPAGAATGLVGLNFGSILVYSPTLFSVIGPGPYVTGFLPVRGSAGTPVTISGFGFTGVTNVLFNGVNGTSGSVQGDTQITVSTPGGVTTGPITVISPSGTFVTSSNFFVPSVITSFSPILGSAGTNVFIRGSNFIGTTAVLFNGSPAASFSVTSPTNLTAVVPAGVTTGPITLVAPGGGFVTSSNFTVLPTILGFSPPGGPPGTLVIIRGQNFGASSVTVEFNGVASAGVLTNNGGTNLAVYVPNTATTGPITVINSIGSAVSAGTFYLTPTIFSLFPIGGPPGATIAISGQNFTGVTNVMFGSLSAAFTILSSAMINAIVPAGIITAPVVVSNPGGASSSGGASPVYFYGPPVITSLSTNAGKPGVVISIFGTNLLGTTSLTFGGVKAASTNVINNNQINATVPNGVLSGPIALQTLGGSFTTVGNFYGPPSITGISPASGFPNDKVTISGINFLGVSRVTFGAIPAAGFVFVDNQTIQATVPAGVVSGVITVTTPGGTVSSSASFSPGQPLLTTSLLSGGRISVSWPSSLSNWVLQAATALTPAGLWTNSSAPVSVVGTENVVTIPISSPAEFFRLKQ